MYIRHGSIWEFSHQATRDLVTAATLAYEDKDLDAQHHAKRNWKDVSMGTERYPPSVMKMRNPKDRSFTE